MSLTPTLRHSKKEQQRATTESYNRELQLMMMKKEMNKMNDVKGR